jgi:hypothetical protein
MLRFCGGMVVTLIPHIYKGELIGSNFVHCNDGDPGNWLLFVVAILSAIDQCCRYDLPGNILGSQAPGFIRNGLCFHPGSFLHLYRLRSHSSVAQ